MSSGGPCQVPLIELLRSIPKKATLQWHSGDEPFAWHTAPVGKHCHDAADELESWQRSYADAASLWNEVNRALLAEVRRLQDESETEIRITCKGGLWEVVR